MSSTFQTISPVDGSVYVERQYADGPQIDAVLARAKRASLEWRAIPLKTRQALVSDAVRRLVAMKEAVAEEITWQMGRPIAYSPFEINGLQERAEFMIHASASALAPIEPEPKDGFKRYIQKEPLGTVFVISPWNYPFLTSINTIIPALLAGNSVVLKHSIQTPLCAERYQNAFDAAGLPNGVFSHLHLTHEDTDKVIHSEAINFIAFTGSVAGGAHVEKAAAGRFVGVGLELGGKDPAYIRQDADLEQAVATTVDGAMFNSGQSCCGLERIYVHQDRFSDYVEKASELIHQYQLGRPEDPATTLGPLAKASASDSIRGQIQDALQSGATHHIDPKKFCLDAPGTPYLAPQLLTDVHHKMRIMREETFGPVMTVMPVKSDSEAIALMNDSDFGLTASVFTQDLAAAEQIGNQVHTGTWFMNRCDYLDPALAWTGVKNSGRGCALSALGFDQLTRPKSFHLKRETQS